MKNSIFIAEYGKQNNTYVFTGSRKLLHRIFCRNMPGSKNIEQDSYVSWGVVQNGGRIGFGYPEENNFPCNFAGAGINDVVLIKKTYEDARVGG